MEKKTNFKKKTKLKMLQTIEKSKLEFREITINDREWINTALKSSDFRGCEYSFANNFAWRRLSDARICQYKGFYLLVTTSTEKPYFTFPAGVGDYKDVFAEMEKYSKERNSELIVTSVCPDKQAILADLFPGKYTLLENRDSYDYLYLSEDLISLKGKKYHGKRNHLNKFYQYNWEYKDLTPDLFDKCIEFSAKTYNDKAGFSEFSTVVEQYAINAFFSFFKEMELKGGVLLVDGEIVAFTIGEQLNSDTFCIHIEKANTDFQGSFTAINQEFAKRNINCKYINREEDMGIDGLRQAKKSYYPIFLLEKKIAVFNDNFNLF